LKLGFVSYPLMTNMAFEAFSCYQFTKSQWLKVDVAIQCGSAKHRDAKILAWIAIVMYPIGLLLIYGSLLFSARHAIMTNRPTALSRAIAFLYREYEPSFFWWELVEMLRRFVLVGLMVLAQGSMLQLVIGTLLSATFLLFQVQASPYKNMSDDFLASGSSFALVAIFLCSYAFKDSAFFGLDDIKQRMSEEQRDLYVINQGTLTLIMIASTLGSILLSFVLFIIQFSIEAARMRREQRASKARRLRYKSNNQEVRVMDLDDQHYHTFLSHVWGTGQDQMRIVKQRLLEMIPELHVFLDVDDLEEIGDLEAYVERTVTVLVYCSRGYFTSKNCMRELASSVAKKKPIIALIDLDESRGGLSLEAVHNQLVEADGLALKWKFLGSQASSSGAEYQEAHIWPGGEALHAQLFADEPIEWNRISHFQDVTMRLTAERLLVHDCIDSSRPPTSPARADQSMTGRTSSAPRSSKRRSSSVESTKCSHNSEVAGTTYVDRELTAQKLRRLGPPRSSYHVYCSNDNPGAAALMQELARECSMKLIKETGLRHRASSFMERVPGQLVELASSKWDDASAMYSAQFGQRRRHVQKAKDELHVATSAAGLSKCDHMVLYLTSQTWTRGEGSGQLGKEVMEAMDKGVHILLAHEMPGLGGQDARFACEFETFFSYPEGATPDELLTRGIYSQIAVPLKGGAWRDASMRLLAKSVALSEADVANATEGGDVLGLGEAGAAQMARVTKFRRSMKRGMTSSNLTSAASGLTARLRLPYAKRARAFTDTTQEQGSDADRVTRRVSIRTASAKVGGMSVVSVSSTADNSSTVESGIELPASSSTIDEEIKLAI